MKSSEVGKSISQTEVTNISPHGIWLIVHEREHFLSYEEFPWFKNAPAISIFNVKLLHRKHLHWPDLDVDLDLDSLANLESYHLMYA